MDASGKWMGRLISDEAREGAAIPELITPAALAAYLSISRGTLADWRKSSKNRGPEFIRVGGRIRYALSDVQRYLLSRRVVSRK